MTRHASRYAFAVLLLILIDASGSGAQTKSAITSTELTRAFLIGTADGQIVRDDSKTLWKATATIQRPGTPVARLVATTSRPGNPLDTLKAPPPVLASSECLVDFSDHDALDRLAFPPDGFALYAEDTFTWSPWWHQACNSLDYAEVRPLSPYTHYHLVYEDPDIQPCSGNLIDWDIIHEDGTCEEFDPRDKARRLSTHDGSAAIHVYVNDGNPNTIFGLNGLRVLGDHAVRLCYKPVQEIDGPWETSEPDGSTSPGIWLCWDELGIGTWDLSDYAGFITEVQISSTGHAGVITIDDIKLKVY